MKLETEGNVKHPQKIGGTFSMDPTGDVADRPCFREVSAVLMKDDRVFGWCMCKRHVGHNEE